MGKSCSQNGRRKEYFFKFLTCKPTGKRLLGGPWLRWENNIRMDLKKWVSIIGIVLIPLKIGIIGEPL